MKNFVKNISFPRKLIIQRYVELDSTTQFKRKKLFEVLNNDRQAMSCSYKK